MKNSGQMKPRALRLSVDFGGTLVGGEMMLDRQSAESALAWLGQGVGMSVNGREPGAIARLAVNGQVLDPFNQLILQKGDQISVEAARGGDFGLQEDAR